MEPVSERPALSPPFGRDAPAIARWASSVTSIIVNVFQQFGYRLNRTLPKDGTEAMTGPLELETYTTATKPSASDYEASIIYVSDASAGSKFQGSDGSSWVSLG